jgi:LPS export ABC transporter protein LptC
MNNSWNAKIPPLGVLVGAFFIVLAAWCGGCGSGEPRVSPATGEAAEVPDQVFDGFEMNVTDNGVRKGWVTAERAEKFDSRKLFVAFQLKVIFYSSTGEVSSVLTSKKGLIHTDTEDMEAMDSVVVISADSSRTLETPELVWKKTENQIVSDSSVVVRTREGVVHGDGIVTDAGFENLEVVNPTGDISVLQKKR